MWVFSGIFFLLAAFRLSWSQPQPVLIISAQDLAGFSRVILSSTVPLSYSFQKKPSALVVSVETKVSLRVQQAAFKSELVESVGWSRGKDSYAFSLELRSKGFSFEHKVRTNPFELTIDLQPAEEPKETAIPVQEPIGTEIPAGATALSPSVRPTGVQETKKFRTIVIDPGHGGLETGAKGKFGALEKDITLAISLKLKDIVEKNLAFRVFLTRDKDTDLSLENRSALANNHKADLFISVHANGSIRKNARGSETYFLSLNATDEESRRLAYMENTVGRSGRADRAGEPGRRQADPLGPGPVRLPEAEQPAGGEASRRGSTNSSGPGTGGSSRLHSRS